MKKTILLSLLLACVIPFWSTAQETSPNRKKITITPEQVQSTAAAESSLRNAQTISTLKPLKIKFADPVENFFTLALNWPKSTNGSTNLSFEYREKKRNKWSEWKTLPVDRHGEEESSVEATEMKQLDARVKSIQIRVLQPAGQSLPEGIQINLFNPVLPQNPGSASLNVKPTNQGPLLPELRSCPCPLPQMVGRDTWGAPRPCASPSYAAVTHMVVHHSAGGNTSSNWAQVVLSIWDFHVNTRAYCDVAYNYLIDPNGVLYEGRSGGNNVIGAHFCATNTGTMGVCLLGNFQEVQPTDAMLNTLANVLAWKSCNSNLDPLTKSIHARSTLDLNHVCGHRDGCATECPGTNVYNKLASVRSKVVSNIQACNFTVGIDAPKGADYHIDIIPNPAQQSFRLQVSNGLRITQLELYNLMGQRMGGVQFDASTLQVNCGNLPRGAYVVRVLDAQNRISARQIVLQ